MANDRASGTVEMDQLAIAMNEALGTHLDEKTARMIRQKGRYQSAREKSAVKLELVDGRITRALDRASSTASRKRQA